MNARTAWKILFSFARQYEWAYPDGYAPFNTLARVLSPLSWNFGEWEEREFSQLPSNVQQAAMILATYRPEFDRHDFTPKPYERLGMSIREHLLNHRHPRWHKWNYHPSQGFAPLEAKPLVDQWIGWGDSQALEELGNFN